MPLQTRINGENTFCVIKSIEQLKKFKNFPLTLLQLKTDHVWTQKTILSRETVPLNADPDPGPQLVEDLYVDEDPPLYLLC
jgi:hypothetical protein